MEILKEKFNQNNRYLNTKIVQMEAEEPIFNEEKFKKGVFYLINSWPVLLLSIENGWINENNKKLINSNEIAENKKKKNWFQTDEEIINNFSEELSKYILGFYKNLFFFSEKLSFFSKNLMSVNLILKIFF